VVCCLHYFQVVRFKMRPCETPEEARARRLCRFKLGLPPEIVYPHVREGVAVIATLCVVLAAVVAWQLGQLATIAPALVVGPTPSANADAVSPR